jgi:oligopeptide transport system substrate-binding protein
VPGRFARWWILAPLALALLACGDGSAPAPKGERGQSAIDVTTLRRGNGPEPDSLDPQRARTDNAFNVLRDLFEGLTAIGDDGMPVPAAAESWTITPDGREYRFRLREGLRWSNGDAVVAQDFVTGLRRLVDPQTASQYAQVLEPVVNAGAIIRGEKPPAELGVDAPDERTLVLRLVNPAPYILGLVAHPSTFPVHAPSLARHGTDFARPGLLVSNGAFALEEWIVG